MKFSIESLGANHVRDGFDCGEESLNRYLYQYALQHQRKNMGRVYVAVRPKENMILGYYTLANGSVSFHTVPKAANLPQTYPIPVILLARLAIDRKVQGQGLGSVLLFDALKRAVAASQLSAAYAIMVDALHDKAKKFYQHFHFEESLMTHSGSFCR